MRLQWTRPLPRTSRNRAIKLRVPACQPSLRTSPRKACLVARCRPECVEFLDFDLTLGCETIVGFTNDHPNCTPDELVVGVFGESTRRLSLATWFAARIARGHAVVVVSFGITRDIRTSLQHAGLLPFISRIYGTSAYRRFTLDVWENVERQLDVRMIPSGLQIDTQRNSAYSKAAIVQAIMRGTGAASANFYDQCAINAAAVKEVPGLICNPCGAILKGLSLSQIQFCLHRVGGGPAPVVPMGPR
jgi:hypothetical protein